MGEDDRNEGSGPGACLEHVFVEDTFTFTTTGATTWLTCVRCGAEAPA